MDSSTRSTSLSAAWRYLVANRGRFSELVAWLVLVASSLIFLYTAGFGSFSTLTQRALHWTFMSVAVFLLLRPTTLFTIAGKWICAIAAATAGIYVLMVWPQRIFGIGGVPLPDQVMGIVALVVILIALRLSVGWGLTVTAAAFLLYAVYGPIFPGFLGHSGVGIPRLVNHLYLTAEGIFGIALGISATYIIVFVIFGAFLSTFGGGQWFVDVSYALAGRFRGGPAKTAIVASGLMGMISGAPVANVATTGTFTIPLMKRVGYQPSTAGAIEAVASTGGMFLPPVMGAGAFIMAEYLRVPYLTIVTAAIIPAVLYYVALFLIADSRAAKGNLSGLPPESLPSLWETGFKRGYHAIPLAFLIITIVIGWSPLRAAFWSIMLATALSIVNVVLIQRDPWDWIKKVFQSLYSGSKQTVPIAMACAGAGIIVGVLGVTGLGTKIASGLVGLSGGEPLPALFFTMISAIILGAGMPVTAVYIILAATLAQPLAMMGIPPLAAHFFIFMFAAVAGLTPPVAITSYTAAGIAGANLNATAIRGFLFGLPGFIIPYMFVVSPALLMQGQPFEIVLAAVTALIGVASLVAAIEGYLYGYWGPVARIALFGAALLSLRPGALTDVVGLSVIVLVFVLRYLLSRADRPAVAPRGSPTQHVDPEGP